MYLVVIRGVQDVAPSIIPVVLVPVLEDFIKMMLTELPRWLPPKCKVDHVIRLVTDVKP